MQPADIDAVTGPTLLIAADPKLDQQMNTTFYAYTDKVWGFFSSLRMCACDCVCVAGGVLTDRC